MSYSDRVETRAPLRLQFAIGMRVPLYCTASGKLYLSTLPKSRRKSVISKLKLEQHARNNITDPNALMAEIDLIEQRQVSIDNQELYDDVTAIAVPIRDRHGRLYSGLAIQAPTTRISNENSGRYIPLLREAAQGLSRLTDDD